ncbi:hypothetical protein [Actinocrispum sp. NPDC049592]|uniref:hypothetical protein n=1 Tax=Actinocrispum sp. NPDC049592 TaxID=3154835 RepID=UPI00341A39C0
MSDVNFLYRLRDIYRIIDCSLDARDPKMFHRACKQLREALGRVQVLIDGASVADIVLNQPPHPEPSTSGMA